MAHTKIIPLYLTVYYYNDVLSAVMGEPISVTIGTNLKNRTYLRVEYPSHFQLLPLKRVKDFHQYKTATDTILYQILRGEN